MVLKYIKSENSIVEKRVQLVTGAAGFIGHKVSQLLLERGDIVIGIDNLNDYYDIELKKHRLDSLSSYSDFSFYKIVF